MLKVLVPLALIVMMVSTVYAAPPTQLWSDAVGTNDIALSKDGNYVAVASGNQLRFYGRSSSTPIWTATAPSGTVESVAISANGDCVVAGGQLPSGGDIAFWNNARSLTGTPSPTWSSVNLNGPISRRCLDISDDGNYVAACGTDTNVFYWANARGLSGSNKPVSWQSRLFDNVMSIDLSSDGNYVAATIENGIALSSLVYWKNARTLTGSNLNPDWISSTVSDDLIDVAISDDGNYIASAGTGFPSPVYYWANAKTLSGNPSATWMGAPGVDFFSVDISSDGDSVIAGGIGPNPADVGVYFWSGARGLSGTPNPTWVYPTETGIHDVAIDDAGEYMAAVQSVAIPHKVDFFGRAGDLKWSYVLDNPSLVVSISGDGATLAVGTSAANTGYLLSTGFSSRNLPNPVGGVVLPTSKLEIVAPFAALAGLIAVVSAVVVVKKRRA
jgi:hypothetical protein